MAKKVTLSAIDGKIDALTAMLGDVVEILGKRFDKIDARLDATATKANIVRLQEQAASIEAQLRLGYETRLGNLEEEVFGAPRR